MALSPCNTTVDRDQRELVEHGTAAFPVACYHDDLSVYEVPWHWHEELEAVVIERGQTLVAVGNEKYIIRAGEGFVINSGILHGCWDWEHSGCLYHSLVFHPRLVGGSLDSVFYQTYVQPLTRNHTMPSIHLKPEIPWQQAALRAIEAAWQAGVQEPFGYEFKMRSALSELVLLLRENVPSTQHQPGSKAVRDGSRIKEMLQFIHTHCAEDLNTREIARVAAISESECLRCFRSTIGITPIQYVRQYRIQKAVELLSGTDLRISDIALQCGFQDVSYFAKTFRELKGCAPGAFRKNKQD